MRVRAARRIAAAGLAAVTCAGGPGARAFAAEPPHATLAAWEAVVRQIEEAGRLRQPEAERAAGGALAPGGMAIAELPAPEVPGGTVQHWCGAILLPDVRLDRLLDALREAPPAQADVLASRVLWRAGPRMGVYLRLVRHSLITVTYDTEHDVTIERLARRVAVSRSVMTTAREVRAAGTPDERVVPRAEDRGFLWRLNVYWSYVETPSGVWVGMESLTLGRATPALLRPLAAPMVRRIAEESVRSALDGLRARFP